MEAGGDEDGDLRFGAPLPDLRQEDWQGNFAGHRPGVVTGDQGDPLFALCQLPELRGADGVLQGLPHQLLLAFFGLVVVHFGSDHCL